MKVFAWGNIPFCVFSPILFIADNLASVLIHGYRCDGQERDHHLEHSRVDRDSSHRFHLSSDFLSPHLDVRRCPAPTLTDHSDYKQRTPEEPKIDSQGHWCYSSFDFWTVYVHSMYLYNILWNVFEKMTALYYIAAYYSMSFSLSFPPLTFMVESAIL